MKLSGIVLVYAILGSSDVTAATALTGINPMQERELNNKRKRETSNGSHTKSGKAAADPNDDNSATARTIVDNMGCNNGHVCGHACFTVDGEDAVEALKKIASGADSAVLFATHVSFGLGICDSDLKCQAKNPADESTYVKGIQFFKDVHTACGVDVNPLTEFEVVYGTVKTAVAAVKRMGNVKNIMLKNLLDACGGALGFWSVGYALGYDALAYDGVDKSGRSLSSSSFFIAFFFQFAFAATSATIVAGTVAEKCKTAAYLAHSLMLMGFVHPVVVRLDEADPGLVFLYSQELVDQFVAEFNFVKASC